MSVTEDYVFRPMLLDDIEQVSALETRTNAFPWTRNKIWDCLDVGYDCWVCHSIKATPAAGGKIEAYAVVSRVLDEAGILNLCVAAESQGKGIGRCFLEHLLKQAGEQKIRMVFLEVRKSNKRAIRLYESFGFVRVGLRKEYYPAENGREHALVYSLDLSVP